MPIRPRATRLLATRRPALEPDPPFAYHAAMTNRLRMTFLGTALLGVAACTTIPEYQPVVDMTGHTKTQYDYDLTLCRENAKQIDILAGGAIGIIAGTALGAGIGAAAGDAGFGAATGAAGGVLGGAAAGSLYGTGKTAATGVDPHTGFVRKCLKERGYTLLDPDPTQTPPKPAAGQP